MHFIRHLYHWRPNNLEFLSLRAHIHTMSSMKHRRVATAGGPSGPTHVRGREKLRGSGPRSGKPQVRSGKPTRPDRSIVNEAIPIFAIGRNKSGFWVAQDCDSAAAGLFLSKAGAVRFAKRTSGANGCALMFVASGLELDPRTSIDRAWHDIIPLEVAKFIAHLKLRVRDLWVGSMRGNESQDLIEQELYRNRYRHRSKNDDDLPIERDDHGGRAIGKPVQ